MNMKQYVKTIDGVVTLFQEPLIVGDEQIFNPSEELILAAGWVEYTPHPVEEGQLEYEDRVAELIGLRYTIEDEMAIIREKDTKPEEWNEWYNYCELCKLLVKEEFIQNNLAYD